MLTACSFHSHIRTTRCKGSGSGSDVRSKHLCTSIQRAVGIVAFRQRRQFSIAVCSTGGRARAVAAVSRNAVAMVVVGLCRMVMMVMAGVVSYKVLLACVTIWCRMSMAMTV